MSNEPTDAVFLDLDGCLVDSSRAIPRAMNDALADVGLPAAPIELIHRLIGPPLELFAVEIVRQVGGSIEQAQPFARAYLRRYERRMVADSAVYEGIPQALSELSQRARLIVVTLKRSGLADRLLNELDLAGYIDFVVGSNGTETGKTPLLERAIGRAQPSRSVMVGDQPDDMAAALRAQIPGLGVSWGFGAPDDLIAAGATAIAASPVQLAAAIEEVLQRGRLGQS